MRRYESKIGGWDLSNSPGSAAMQIYGSFALPNGTADLVERHCLSELTLNEWAGQISPKALSGSRLCYFLAALAENRRSAKPKMGGPCLRLLMGRVPRREATHLLCQAALAMYKHGGFCLPHIPASRGLAPGRARLRRHFNSMGCSHISPPESGTTVESA